MYSSRIFKRLQYGTSKRNSKLMWVSRGGVSGVFLVSSWKSIWSFGLYEITLNRNCSCSIKTGWTRFQCNSNSIKDWCRMRIFASPLNIPRVNHLNPLSTYHRTIPWQNVFNNKTLGRLIKVWKTFVKLLSCAIVMIYCSFSWNLLWYSLFK